MCIACLASPASVCSDPSVFFRPQLGRHCVWRYGHMAWQRVWSSNVVDVASTLLDVDLVDTTPAWQRGFLQLLHHTTLSTCCAGKQIQPSLSMRRRLSSANRFSALRFFSCTNHGRSKVGISHAPTKETTAVPLSPSSILLRLLPSCSLLATLPSHGASQLITSTIQNQAKNLFYVNSTAHCTRSEQFSRASISWLECTH